MDILWPKMLKYIYFSKRFHAISYIVFKRHVPLLRFPETFSMWFRSILGTKWHMFHYCCNLWWVQPLYCINTLDYNMVTSSNGNIFRVPVPLWGESTGHRWFLLTKSSDGELWCFLSSPEQTVEQTIWDAIRSSVTNNAKILRPISRRMQWNWPEFKDCRCGLLHDSFC